MEKTNFGFEAFFSYHESPKKEHLERALEYFQRALEQCGPDPTCRATALVNLATSRFIKCLDYGTYSELEEPIRLYEEALELRSPGHPDRPATLLLLSQALLSRLGKEYDESTAAQIEPLLAEILPVDSRDRRTADAIIRTCRLFRSVNSNPLQTDDLPGDSNCDIYIPPYGYFDRPHILHKLGIVSWERFQHNGNLDDLNRSIALNEEAIQLIPEGHEEQASIVACLGKSFLRRLEVSGEPTDVDMSANLGMLGGRVITALDSISSAKGAAELSAKEELRKQIVLMMVAENIFQYIDQEFAPLRIPVERLTDEWRKEDSVPERCKRELGVLLSFLGGEGEIKMGRLLAGVDWPFKKYKIEETTQALQNYFPYFEDFAAKLEINLTSTVLVYGSTPDALAAAAQIWVAGEY